MIRTTTKIRGTRVQRDQIVSQIDNVRELVADANGRYAKVEVEFSASFDQNQSASKDKVSASVVVTR